MFEPVRKTLKDLGPSFASIYANGDSSVFFIEFDDERYVYYKRDNVLIKYINKYSDYLIDNNLAAYTYKGRFMIDDYFSPR